MLVACWCLSACSSSDGQPAELIQLLGRPVRGRRDDDEQTIKFWLTSGGDKIQRFCVAGWACAYSRVEFGMRNIAPQSEQNQHEEEPEHHHLPSNQPRRATIDLVVRRRRVSSPPRGKPSTGSRG